MRLLLLLVALVFWSALPTYAAPVPVRSGEHATFSRLVFPDAPGRGWDVARDGERVEIRFSAGLPELDLGRVFALIPRARIRGVASEGDTLSLDLGCDCPVRVFQIPTGHIVIDVENPRDGSVPTVSQRPAAVADFRLGLGAMELPILSALVASPPQAAERLAALVEPEIAPERLGNQLRRHPMGQVPLLPAAPPAAATALVSGACEVEAVAREVLVADPTEAIGALAGLRANLVSGTDVLDPAAVERLSRTYLQLGWGAEAVMTAGGAGFADDAFRTVSAALDGQSFPRAEWIDPGCGPAAAVIALLTGVDARGWSRADEAGVIQLLDAFPRARWRDLADRIHASLVGLNETELLTGLQTIVRDPVAAESEADVAGTDIAAVQATTRMLASANASGQPVALIHLENARALRPSVPQGALRDALDAALVEALVLARDAEAVTQMVAAGQTDAATVLDHVTRHALAEDGAGFIVRLEPHMEPSDPLRFAAQAALLDLGLEDAARRFAPLPAETLPEIAEPAIVDEEPWLSRDFVALTAAPEIDWTVRTRVASSILRRNEEPMPPTDLAAADRVLTEGRETADLVRQLLDGP